MNNKKIRFFSIFALIISLFLLVSCDNNNNNVTVTIPSEISFNQVVKVECSEEILSINVDDSTIIEVVDNNSIKGIKIGTTNVNVVTSKKTVTQEVSVIDSLAIELPSQIICGENTPIVVYTSDGVRVTSYDIEISDETIVKYRSGFIMPKKTGNVTITISYQDITKVINLEVINEVRLSVDDRVKVGEIVNVKVSNAEGKAMNDAILTSSNPDVVKVNSLKEVEVLSEGKATLTLTWNGLSCSKTVNAVKKFTYNYQEVMKVNDEFDFKVLLQNEDFTDYDLTSSDSSILEITGTKCVAKKEGTVKVTINLHGNYEEEIEITVASMTVSAVKEMKRDGVQYITPKFNPSTYSEEFEITSSDPEIIKVENNKLVALKPGTATIIVTTVNGFKSSVEIKVNDVYYTITFDISEEDKALMPEGFMEKYSKFSAEDLPIALPVLAKKDASFLGWKINNSSTALDLDEMTFEISEETKYNVTVTAFWGLSRLDLSYESSQVIGIGDTTKIIVTPYMVASYIDTDKLVWGSDDERIVEVNDGVVTGISEGSTLITVYCEDNPDIIATIGITVKGELSNMSELLKYFVDSAQAEIVAKNILVYGYQFNYQYRLLGSVTSYLFEDLVIDESIKTAIGSNRPGTVTEKYYIVVHDTASTASTATAQAHAKYVQDGGGGTSWHYSVGNDGIYHQIPDNEVAYHAGDGHDDSSRYVLLETGVKGTEVNPTVTITADGYYAINGSKTKVLAPTYEGKILTTSSINDLGIRVIVQDGYYYIGKTYYNKTYNKISNYGGNMNSIGMETMVNYGSDIYYTWQKTAKLVAYLMKENNLTINDVKPHHYFAGKNCPETMRGAGLWDYFLGLVQFEYDMITKYEGYTVTFKSNNPEYVNEYGRVIKQDENNKSVSYTITVTKDGVSDSITLWTVIPGSSQFSEIKAPSIPN